MANAGATENQMMFKFNWKNPKMAQEYISASKPLLKRTASMLTGIPVEDPKVAKLDHTSNPGPSSSMLPKEKEADKEEDVFEDEEFFGSFFEDDDQAASQMLPKKASTKKSNGVNVKNRAASKMLPKKANTAKDSTGDTVDISMSGAQFTNCTVYVYGAQK